MDLTIPQPYKLLPIEEYQWFVVQFDNGPQKFIRKVVRSSEIIWNQLGHIPTNFEGMENVMIMDHGERFTGYIAHKAVDEKDALSQNKFLQIISMQLTNSLRIFDPVMEQLHNKSFWILVVYSTESTFMNGEECIFAIFHSSAVVLKIDNQSRATVAYIREQQTTHKCIVLKAGCDLREMTLTLDNVKITAIQIFKDMEILMRNMKNSMIQNNLENIGANICDAQEAIPMDITIDHPTDNIDQNPISDNEEGGYKIHDELNQMELKRCNKIIKQNNFDDITEKSFNLNGALNPMAIIGDNRSETMKNDLVHIEKSNLRFNGELKHNQDMNQSTWMSIDKYNNLQLETAEVRIRRIMKLDNINELRAVIRNFVENSDGLNITIDQLMKILEQGNNNELNKECNDEIKRLGILMDSEINVIKRAFHAMQILKIRMYRRAIYLHYKKFLMHEKLNQ